ncbi:MAG: hypothetical protein QXW77_03765 [Candidatus Hadarchaeales archaeon]
MIELLMAACGLVFLCLALALNRSRVQFAGLGFLSWAASATQVTGYPAQVFCVLLSIACLMIALEELA